jgi:deoxycytidine triphosphate deaminase
MIIGPKILLKLVKEKKLVEGLAERELTTPEGAGFDLRLGELFAISGKAFLGEFERETPKIKSKIKYSSFAKASADKQKSKRKSITIKPGGFYLATTIEKVNTPLDITINFKPRTTTFRSGLFLRTGNVAPGYCGKLTFAIKNEGPVPVKLEMGCRIVHAQFEWVDGGGSQYKGQWQGGRVTTGKREKQI